MIILSMCNLINLLKIIFNLFLDAFSKIKAATFFNNRVIKIIYSILFMQLTCNILIRVYALFKNSFETKP